MEPENDLASRRILAVTEEELSRIVLDIHDGPVQYLFAALSLLTRVQHQVESRPDDPGCQALLPEVTRVSELVESSLHEIKNFLGTFRPPEFHRRSLASIVHGLIIQHEEWTGHTVDLTMGAIPENVALPVKIALYRILQEALSNAYRHSGANEQWVRLWSEKKYIYLEIVDKGRGFEPPPLDGPQATEREEHIGLRGMRDRVELLGGTLHLTSHPGQGTTITVKVPTMAVKGIGIWPSAFE